MTSKNSWQIADDAGIKRLSIPTPFAVGDVNAYLIEDDPLTLIDGGPNTATAFVELERQLDQLGYAIADLELILVTHQHMDHLGLTSILAERANASIGAFAELARYLGDFHHYAERDDSYGEKLMLRHGVSADVAHVLYGTMHAIRSYGTGADVDRKLEDGEEIKLRDRTLTVAHRPGHSPTDTLFIDKDRQIAFVADHVLKDISSNPLVCLPANYPDDTPIDDHPKALMTYLDSLQKTYSEPLELLLPGHGDPVTNHKKLINARLTMHKRRTEKILQIIRTQSRSAFSIAQEIWGDNIALTQAFLVLSEVLGHTDLLVDEGLITQVEVGDNRAQFKAI